ncbi:hypothetical protein, partial [Escherichia coli]|uniref:hypothetical protein n=1 Tax=Escherichia coli TaxID=562 RepID=UPI00226445B4
ELKLIAAANDFKQISITKSDLIKEISKLVSSICSNEFRWKVKKAMNDTLIIMKGMLSDQRSESYEKFKSLLSSIDSSY